MPRTFQRQDFSYSSDVYDDTIAPSLANFETNPLTAEQDMNNQRSMISHLRDVQAGDWWAALIAPTALENGSARGVQNVNDALHLLEKKRVLTCVWNLHSVAGGAGQHVVLGVGELPATLLAAIGAVTTLGTVAAQATTLGTASAADVVAGTTAIAPRNLVELVDAVTRDPLLDAGDRIYGLLQTESGADGHTITAVASERAQISFVKISGGSALALVTAGALNGVNFDYCHRERVRFEDLSEDNFLGGANVDVPAGTTVTRQAGYDNQGATAVNLTNNATLDLEAPGIEWQVRDDLQALLMRIVEGSAGGTSKVQIHSDVDSFDVDAAVNDFAQGVSMDSGNEKIDVGVTAGVIESTGANLLTVRSASNLLLDDGNRSGSTWADPGIKLANSTPEWSAFEAEFGGEVSLFAAIIAASSSAARTKGSAALILNVSADTDVDATTTSRLDADLPDYSGVGSFVDDVDVFLNGALLRGGANAAANNDVYPGTTPAQGMLKFEFALHGLGSQPDALTMIVNG